MEINHIFQPIKMSKIEKSIINIILIYKNNNYYKQKNFAQINNYDKLGGVKNKIIIIIIIIN